MKSTDPSTSKAVSVIAMFLFCVNPQSVRCQPGALPVPEYFGIYAASNGHLIKLDVRDIRAEKMVSIKMGQRQAVGNILNGGPVASSQMATVPSLSADLKIIVYSESGAMASPLQIAKSLSIVPLVFVRNLNVDTGFPNNVRRSGAENGWEYGSAPELPWACNR